MSSALCLVLHAHQPYVRRHGSWPCGEDWYHQAATEAYLPLAEAFTRLADDGHSGFATVSFTPVLASQMADPYLTRELRLFLGRTMLRAERQVANYRGPWRDELVSLAAGTHVEAGALEARLGSEWASGTHVPWRALAEAGAVETWTSAPTHAFLPGLRDDALEAAGWRAAAKEHQRVFGVRPAGAWLPECGYRPGLEAGPAAAGLGTILVDEPALGHEGDPLRAVRTSGVRAVVRARARSLLVSGPGGYPGGAAYRDFHHYDEEAGFKSFAVTRPAGEGGPKSPYDPAAGAAAARDDARSFVRAVREALASHRSRTGRDGLLVAAFDLELFGHWWFEGPAFLEAVIRELSAGGDVRPLTVSEALAAVPAG
ncbi:MAG: 1,4-alpha-glucan branching protein, partial [Actinomycetota bacterium]